jgi:hypothetical protein
MPINYIQAGLALFQFGAGLAQFDAEMQAAQAKEDARKLEAFNIETEKVRSETEAAQRHNDRLEQFRLNTKANIAAFSATGRDIGGTTVKAFMERQKEIAAEDTRRSDLMGMFEAMKLKQAARTARLEGYAEKKSATLRAYSGLFESTVQAAQTGYSSYSKPTTTT